MTEQAELIACYELTQAKAKYCRTLDTRDWNGLAALMTEDIEFGMGDGHSEPQMTVGRDETLALLQSLVAGSKTAHQVHTPEIDLNEDEAQVIIRPEREPTSRMKRVGGSAPGQAAPCS
ncbi:nuclear transport factor 2 family protein [Mycobacterium sp. 050128]|uniref:nuclear transport factor 2 family protein n=1 Tax=Mycobacterium sp. 050128 TaxID=3096112 RepID=UPI002ED9A82A